MPAKLLLPNGDGEIIVDTAINETTIKFSYNFSFSVINVALLADSEKKHVCTINFKNNCVSYVRGEERYKWDYAYPTTYHPRKVFEINDNLYFCISAGIMKIDTKIIASQHTETTLIADAVSYPCEFNENNRIVNLVVFRDDIYYQLPVYPECNKSTLYIYDTQTNVNKRIACIPYWFWFPIIVTNKNLFLLLPEADNSDHLRLTKVGKKNVSNHMVLDGSLAYEQDQIVSIKNNVFVFSIYGEEAKDTVLVINTSNKSTQIKEILFEMDNDVELLTTSSTLIFSCYAIGDHIYLVRLVWKNDEIDTTRFILQIVDKNLKTLKNFDVDKEITDNMTCKLNQIVHINDAHICWRVGKKKYCVVANITNSLPDFDIIENS